ncbi:uncharacterized protein B0H18DRAFT_313018 [Fomitopsis serialis]|uniref:uncharacterized protein n=1 Tax=Fomitopsis serialis TaxID=139415 RepID=UPI0020074C42|nr:uncharacterized protein B0H18DRAFT_313018 [Neoantrodia serialis]KAH9936121.1 hypothetical protein B0H18DRAFT_313018 [Neoantrodia serialis]
MAIVFGCSRKSLSALQRHTSAANRCLYLCSALLWPSGVWATQWCMTGCSFISSVPVERQARAFITTSLYSLRACRNLSLKMNFTQGRSNTLPDGFNINSPMTWYTWKEMRRYICGQMNVAFCDVHTGLIVNREWTRASVGWSRPATRGDVSGSSSARGTSWWNWV